MSERFKNVLERLGAEKVDQKLVDALRREMAAAVPEIVECIRQREALAAEFRLNPRRSPRAASANED